jgi:hypothetical protein
VYLSGYFVRTFRDGDEEAVVRLFNEVYSGHGGFVPRTVEYWRWCCLKRPDVDLRGVFVVSDGQSGAPVGYAVVGTSGNIWELCAAGDDTRQVASLLLDQCVKYLGDLGVSSVNVNVPSDAYLDAAFVKSGFARVPAERMFLSTLNPSELFSALVADRKEQLVGRLNEDIAFRLKEVPFGVEDDFSVSLHGDKLAVTRGSQGSPEVVVTVDFRGLLSVLFSGVNPYRLLLAGRLRVKPFWKARAVLRFLSLVRVGGSWFFPMSDFG